jgi:hypothetical protein
MKPLVMKNTPTATWPEDRPSSLQPKSTGPVPPVMAPAWR